MKIKVKSVPHNLMQLVYVDDIHIGYLDKTSVWKNGWKFQWQAWDFKCCVGVRDNRKAALQELCGV